MRVELNLSTIPSVWGWYGVVWICLVPVIAQYCFMVLETKLVPLSERISFGVPKRAVKSSRQLITVSEVVLGIA